MKRPAIPAGLRIVRALQLRHADASASRLKRAVLEGQVTVDGNVVDDPGALVLEGQEAVWDPNRRVQRRVDTRLEVLHECPDDIVVLKPAGLLTHPTEAREKDTLLSRVSAYTKLREKGRRKRPSDELDEGDDADPAALARGYVAVVHRLDKETSGVLVFARSRRALVSLQAQLRAHSMDRRYTALVEGDLKGDRGTFDQDLVEDRGDRRRGVAKPGEKGLRAITEWSVLERFGIATLVEARLKTGRTHQIRVHFASAGHALVGDPIYRDPKRPPFPVAFPRQALHAGRLGFVSPDGETITVEAPPPPDFAQLLAKLRARQVSPARATPAGPGSRPK